MARYVLSPDGKALTCLECGALIRRWLDVQQRYCERCQQYLEEEGRPWACSNLSS